MIIEDINGKKHRVIKLKARAAEIQEKDLFISTDFIKLDSALKLADIAQTGGHAKIIIENGEIRVNGEECTHRGKKLRAGDNFRYGRAEYIIKQK